ncbi:MAG: GNAT family N-acetyltransferase, partial [Phycicoccus sp.]
MSRSEVLRTDRLVVTTWHPDDVDELLEVHSDAETMRFVRHGRPESRDEVAALIGEYIADHDRTGVTKWRASDHEGRLVGRAGFGIHDKGRELGYTVRRDRWGQGLATELARALVCWHREHAGHVPLRAYVSQHNPASARVLEKVGFEPVGTVERRADVHLLYRLPDR